MNWAPEACTLPTVEQPLRVSEFYELFRNSARSIERSSSTHARVIFDPEAEAQAQDLAARERSCCSFFIFAFTDTEPGLAMDVTVPDAQADVLDALLAIAREARHD